MRISDWSSGVCSSDLAIAVRCRCGLDGGACGACAAGTMGPDDASLRSLLRDSREWAAARDGGATHVDARHGRGQRGCHMGGLSRSEEHTSELQSLMRISYAVFCLKKKNKKCNDEM